MISLVTAHLNVSLAKWLLAPISSVYAVQSEGPAVTIAVFPLPRRSRPRLAAAFYCRGGEQTLHVVSVYDQA